MIDFDNPTIRKSAEGIYYEILDFMNCDSDPGFMAGQIALACRHLEDATDDEVLDFISAAGTIAELSFRGDLPQEDNNKPTWQLIEEEYNA